jgi:hypothetical protein
MGDVERAPRHHGAASRGLATTHLALPYDNEAAARLAAANGFPQWAASLTNGWVGTESLDRSRFMICFETHMRSTLASC